MVKCRDVYDLTITRCADLHFGIDSNICKYTLKLDTKDQMCSFYSFFFFLRSSTAALWLLTMSDFVPMFCQKHLKVHWICTRYLIHSAELGTPWALGVYSKAEFPWETPCPFRFFKRWSDSFLLSGGVCLVSRVTLGSPGVWLSCSSTMSQLHIYIMIYINTHWVYNTVML